MATIGSFKVPLGLSPEERIVHVSKALRGIAYRCPQCLTPLKLRGGVGKRTVEHFAHQAGGNCSYETVLHAAAKQKLREVVQDWLNGYSNPPTIVFPCQGRTWDLCTSEVFSPLKRNKVDKVILEAQVGNYRPDVVLFFEGKAVLGLEVLVHHEVDEAKAAGSNHTWLELYAMDIFRSPLCWRPVQHNIKRTSRCEFCAEVDFGVLASKIRQHERQAYNWADKAKNPEAARFSLDDPDSFLGRKIAAEIKMVQDVAVARWYAMHKGAPPIPNDRMEDYEAENGESISLQDAFGMVTRGLQFNL